MHGWGVKKNPTPNFEGLDISNIPSYKRKKRIAIFVPFSLF